ncbi:MAG: LysR family transcriptional regulator [Gammaproteobacteria bacterium]|nr:LysR family transcriptional regulator [Gammaproteobacteria bacterium]
MNITLRQLQVFDAVARHLNYTRAAEELFLSQPAVSMQIKQLEENLGESLLEQMGKKIYLTEAGKEVYRYSQAIENQLNEMQMVLSDMKGLQHGKLSLTVASTANYFVPTLLGIFNQRHKGVSVDIDVTNRENLLKALAANTTDFAIMGSPPEGLGLELEAHPFMENPLVMLAAPDHPLADRKQIPLQEFTEETLIMREPGSGTRAARERFFKDRGISDFSKTMEMNSNEAIKQAVQAGLGLGVLSIHTMEVELMLKRLVVLDVEGFPIMRHWYIVHRKGKRFSAISQAFKEFVLNEAQSLLKLPSADSTKQDNIPPA